MEHIEINNELTASQRAKKKYYEKMKNDPNYVEKRRARCTKYYYKIKDDEDFKRKVSEHKKVYYQRTKLEMLLEITV